MSNNKDYNILLLKVLAHDLLAPLTAVKWQTELLRKSYKKKEKRERYMNGIASSTELGISLTKHAHVAAKVLSESYEIEPTEGVHIATCVKESINELSLQYERHALALTSNIEEAETQGEIDASLLSLYIWSVGKFFLTCTPPNTNVSASGARNDEGKYEFIMRAEKISDPASCLSAFNDDEDFGTYDQKYVFATLMKKVASNIEARIETASEGETVTINTIFSY